ncbi:hypothetical protein M878_09480 [Streptomyces roseochromogenus subsp. oscitans DS 12.976]|uniref:Uncharacterized protein n=1 Tax=Streptomyces roseochromogenus subsp. oscitans DS 12.976 TaxID=1352936 RepID=V6KRI2_STRRC|nr:hypothetical protein M878_09480 [Streptomyces roseochromogenus subsp. oscitans DS 12.976]
MEFTRDVLQSGEQGDRGLRQAGPAGGTPAPVGMLMT